MEGSGLERRRSTLPGPGLCCGAASSSAMPRRRSRCLRQAASTVHHQGRSNRPTGTSLVLSCRFGFAVDGLSIGRASTRLPIAGKRTATRVQQLMLQHVHRQAGKLGAAHRALVGRRLASGLRPCDGHGCAYRPHSRRAPRPAERAQLVQFDVDGARRGGRHGQPGRASLPGRAGAAGGLVLVSGSTRREASPHSDR